MEPSSIFIKGARQHNLKGIDVEIPRNKFVVITGLSGSGKSSLAFDTLYAEGQRRYVESLSAYARQFLEQMGKPEVDTIEGLSPAISIEQKTTTRNPRSTVGTVTEIYDYLRLLFARIGRPHCFQCGRPITTQTVSQMVDQIMKLSEGAKIHLLSPIVRNRKGEYAKELLQLKKQGFVRVKIDGEVRELPESEGEIKLDKKKKHNIDLVVDRLILKPKIEQRLADSLETALRHSGGIAKIEVLGGTSLIFSEKFACLECGVSYPDISPQTFSFNSPLGACKECNGLGTKMYFDPDLIAPNKTLSLRAGAIVPWERRSSEFYWNMLESIAKHYRFDLNTPFEKLPKKTQNVILHGSEADRIQFSYDFDEKREFYWSPFEGVIPNLARRYKETESDWVREEIERFMNIRPCPACKGARLKEESLAVKIGGLSIFEVTQMSVKKALPCFGKLELTPKEVEIAERILKEIRERLSFMANVGLDYLSLDRAAGTLSGGEAQRIRLATQIGSSLVGVLYILDEPSIGLHQRDNHRLLETLKKLRDLGNTVLVVEHDEQIIRSADYVIDMGPGAGIHGGWLVAAGSPEEILRNQKSLTGQYLSGNLQITTPRQRRRPPGPVLRIVGARENNLKNLTVEIPLGLFVCITGVSGSGKSTLINDTLYKGLAQRLYGSKEPAGKVEGIEGLEAIDKVINIDQSPIGRTPRSNPATYTGLFTFIRDLFSELPEARARGYKPGRFSFNVKGGRCEACEGDGILRIEMHFLPDVYVECEVCKGKRFNRETLEIFYKGKSIAEILRLTAEQALQFFENIPTIRQKLETLIDVGLGYVELGQSATTLSGGEAQRVKLAKELSKRSTGRTLYILDEPTTGLHLADIQKLLDVLNQFVEAGNTVVVIEHHLDVIKTADQIIDLGPEGGDDGGRIVAQGTPEEVAQIPRSYTGQFLKKIFHFLLVLSFAASSAGSAERTVKTGSLGSGLNGSITLHASPEGRLSPAQAASQALEVGRQAYRELGSPSSGEVGQINKNAGKEAMMKVGEDLLRLFRACMQIFDETGGAFDVVKVKGGAKGGVVKIEDPQLKVSFSTGEAMLPDARTYLDFSGIIVGYTIDRMAGFLKSQGFSDFLIQVGDNYRSMGRDGGRRWGLSIPDPAGGKMLCRISLETASIATSDLRDLKGAARRVGRGTPRTTDLRSVTVVTTNATNAVALASTGLILGKERAREMFSRLKRRGFGAILEDAHGKITTISDVTAACFE